MLYKRIFNILNQKASNKNHAIKVKSNKLCYKSFRITWLDEQIKSEILFGKKVWLWVHDNNMWCEKEWLKYWRKNCDKSIWVLA